VRAFNEHTGQFNFKEIFAADSLQIAGPVTVDAIVDCSEWQVEAALRAFDRVDPPGAI
jgi:hypothetical protein